MRFRYSRWDGTQKLDDLDAGDVLDALSDDLMNYGDLNAALQRFLRWGSPNMPGIEQLLKQLRESRERELGRYNLDSTVEELRQKVQDVIDTERAGIERRLQEATPEARKLLDRIARQRNDQLDRLPDDLGGRVKGLRNYEFVDDAARQKFEELMQQLQKQMLDQMFQGIKGSLQQMQGQDLTRARAAHGRPDARFQRLHAALRRYVPAWDQQPRRAAGAPATSDGPDAVIAAEPQPRGA